MEIKKFINQFKLLKIKGLLKFQQIFHKNELNSGENTKEKYGLLKDINNLLDSKQISIKLYKKDVKNKEFIFELIQLLGEYGIKVELYECEQIFNNEEIRS